MFLNLEGNIKTRRAIYNVREVIRNLCNTTPDSKEELMMVADIERLNISTTFFNDLLEINQIYAGQKMCK